MAKSDVLKKLKKAVDNKYADYLDESKVLKEIKEREVKTLVPGLNIALSGSIDGGFQPGHLAIAGESRHFKSNFAIKIASDLMKAMPDAQLVWFDNEFGAPEEYFKNFDMDFERVLHSPVVSVEDLKIQMSKLFDALTGDEKIIMIVDSVGGLASEKEINDAVSGENKQDLTRQRTLKSLFRIIMPQLKLKKVWLITINHVYQTMEMYAKDVMSSGKGSLLSADNQWFIGRRQVKEGTELTGYDFVIKAGKSRFIKEGSAIPITVTHSGGIETWSGLLDIAEEGGYVIKPKAGWYSPVDPLTGEVLAEKNYRRSETNNADFWNNIFDRTNFKEYVQQKFQLNKSPITQIEEEEEVE